MNTVDLAKFICAILVVCIHVPPFRSNVHLLELPLNDLISNCLARIAVPIFFMASGFFLYRNVNSDLKSKTRRYVIKLMKLYLIWTAIYLPLTVYGIHNVGDGETVRHTLGFVRNFIFVGSYIHLWYLPSTIFAVILVSFLLFKGIRLKVIVAAGAILYLVGLFDESWYGFSPQKFDTILYIYNRLFITTRNGLFEGMLFVSLGAYIGRYRPKINHSAFFMLITALALILEFIFLTKNNACREHDMYLFLVPTTFFLFNIITNVELPDSRVFPFLRKMSALIYFSHMLFSDLFLAFNVHFPVSKFLAVMCLSLMVSFCIIKLSDHQGFNWLKNLYS